MPPHDKSKHELLNKLGGAAERLSGDEALLAVKPNLCGRHCKRNPRLAEPMYVMSVVTLRI